MRFIFSCLKGIALGAGAILPGISSGVLCVVFGIYETLVNSILSFFKDVKGNIKFLFPILLGVGIGIVLFGNLLKILFATYPIPTKFAFIGLILGSLPSIFKTANKEKRFQLHHLIYTFATFLIAILLLIIENKYVSGSFGNTSFIFFVFAGFIMSIGVVVPGVSSSVLLMILGVYNTYLFAVASLDFSVLIPMGIGVMIGGIIFLKFTKYCLDTFPSQTYYCIIGFVLGSVLILIPETTNVTTTVFSLGLAFLGFLVARQLERN